MSRRVVVVSIMLNLLSLSYFVKQKLKIYGNQVVLLTELVTLFDEYNVENSKTKYFVTPVCKLFILRANKLVSCST